MKQNIPKHKCVEEKNTREIIKYIEMNKNENKHSKIYQMQIQRWKTVALSALFAMCKNAFKCNSIIFKVSTCENLDECFV